MQDPVFDSSNNYEVSAFDIGEKASRRKLKSSLSGSARVDLAGSASVSDNSGGYSG